MKKSILAVFIILIIFVNAISQSVYASETVTETDEANPIYNVVVPTNFNITVDPYQILDNDSMISSPEYFIINKSSIPVKVDVSFKISVEDGVLLNIVDRRNNVHSYTDEKELWIAAAFSNSIKQGIKQFRVLKTQQGDVVYQYEVEEISTENKEKESVIVVSGSAITTETRVSPSAVSGTGTVIAVSDSAITIKESSISPVSDIGTGTVTAVSGSAITIENSSISPVSDIGIGTVTAVSGSAITIDDSGISPASDIGTGTVTVVSGSAITIEDNGISPASDIGTGTITVVSGSAITIEDSGISPVSDIGTGTITAVSGSAIIIEGSDISLKSDNEEKTVETEEILKTIKYSIIKNELLNAEPVTYQDTIQVVGNYGIISELNEDSTNVFAINSEWSTRTSILDKAVTYELDDGTVVTAGTAENNNGVTAFRFIGTVNTRVKWSETNLKVTIRFTFDGITDEITGEKEIETNEDTLAGSYMKLEQTIEQEEVKSEINIESGNEKTFVGDSDSGDEIKKKLE